ncbi:MAG: glycosyltransferase [Thermoanaerobaculia bacterium]|nr:glycosyltransferase [Thermoanaerobaculia bacterium]
MDTKPSQPDSSPADRLEAAEARVRELEAALDAERETLRYARQRLATKETEIREIHQSRAWAAIAALRSIKYRFVDPLLGSVGISWPPRRAKSAPTAADRGVSLQELRERPDPNAFDVVCLSTCDWDARFQRPQQLMSRFAAAGHRVFYVSQRFRQDGPSWLVERKRQNVYEVTFRGKVLNAFTERLDDRSCEQLMAGLADVSREASLGAAATIVQLPFWWPLAKEARARFGWPVVYDCMDDLAGFSTVRRAMVADEDALLSGADLVTVSSSKLEEHASTRSSSVLVIRNACDFEHFAKAPRANNARPVIGYFGAISDWFDTALVAGLAGRRPDWDFVLVGSTFGADISRLVKLPNVSLTGEEAYESLPEWLGRFDVAIVPFKRGRLTEATNPVKVYEMLAGGRPVVSVPIPEVALLAPMVRLASNVDEFEREIEASLPSDESAIAARRAFARENTWERRFEQLRPAIAATLPRA